MSKPNSPAIFNWIRDFAIHGQLLDDVSYRGETIRTNEEGHLVYERIRKEGREVDVVRTRLRYDSSTRRNEEVQVTFREIRGNQSGFGPVTIAVYAPESKSFLLNGDAFDDQTATRIQTWVRNIIQNPLRPHQSMGSGNQVFPAFQRTKVRLSRRNNLRHVIVPFQAIEGAEIVAESVRPIEVTQDTWEIFTHELGEVPSAAEFEAAPIPFSREEIRPGSWRYRTIKKGRRQFRSIEQSMTVYYKDGERLPTPTNFDQVYVPNPKWDEVADRYTSKSKWITDGRGNPQLLPGIESKLEWVFMPNFSEDSDFPYRIETLVRREMGGNVWVRPLIYRSGVDITILTAKFQERVHRLGSSLFSAIGEDGRRHKFISSFDSQEPEPMYFLAQLPDGSGAKTVNEAVDALAPAIVHHAREDGRNVYRQGDIFAIETNLSDEQVYAMAHTRVRREVVLRFFSEKWLTDVIHGDITGPNPMSKHLKEEVAERLVCPCGCEKTTPRVGWGPRARRALSIYRTGHTATEVVTTRKGTTYVRGILVHDPQIEEPGRRSEHIEIRLGATVSERKVWYLAVRNTVPRRRRGQTQAVTVTAESEASA